MKKNKIYRGYHHEDLTLKFLKENTTKYIAKITGAEFCDEISNITYKVKNNIKLTCNEFLALGILPLMKTKHEAGVQVVKTLELARKITDIDDELKDSVLGILIVLADKFIENQDLKNKVIDVIKMEITILHDYVTSHEKEWLEQGKIEGKIEGKLEGKEEEKLKIAKNMHKENYSVKEIAKITKLDCKTIEKLK